MIYKLTYYIIKRITLSLFCNFTFLLTAMEAPPLSVETIARKQTAGIPKSRIIPLKNLCVHALVNADVNLATYAHKLNHEQAKYVRRKLIHNNLLFFTDLFQSIACTDLLAQDECSSATAFGPHDELVANSVNRQITARVWNLNQMHHDPLELNIPGQCEAHCVAYSPNGKYVVTGSSPERCAHLWDLSQRPLAPVELTGHIHVVEAKFTPDSTQLLTLSEDGALRSWDITQIPLRSSFVLNTGFQPYIYRAKFSNDGRYLVCPEGGYLLIWNLQEPITQITLNAAISAQHPKSNIFFCYDNSKSKIILLVDLEKSNQTRAMDPLIENYGKNGYQITSIAFSLDGNTVLFGSSDGKLMLIKSNKAWLLPSLKTKVDSISINADGSYALVSDGLEKIHLYDLHSQPAKKLTLDFSTPKEKLFYGSKIEFSPSGKYALLTQPTTDDIALVNRIKIIRFYHHAELLSLPIIIELIEAQKNPAYAKALKLSYQKIDNCWFWKMKNPAIYATIVNQLAGEITHLEDKLALPRPVLKALASYDYGLPDNDSDSESEAVRGTKRKCPANEGT